MCGVKTTLNTLFKALNKLAVLTLLGAASQAEDGREGTKTGPGCMC